MCENIVSVSVLSAVWQFYSQADPGSFLADPAVKKCLKSRLFPGKILVTIFGGYLGVKLFI